MLYILLWSLNTSVIREYNTRAFTEIPASYIGVGPLWIKPSSSSERFYLMFDFWGITLGYHSKKRKNLSIICQDGIHA